MPLNMLGESSYLAVFIIERFYLSCTKTIKYVTTAPRTWKPNNLKFNLN